MREITHGMFIKHGILCKVIFENCYLEKEEIRKLAEIAKKVKPDYIKTSTGFGTGGASVEDVKLMKETVGDAVKVKAAEHSRLGNMQSNAGSRCRTYRYEQFIKNLR